MEIIRTIPEMQKRARELHLEGKSIGLVPTMGYLHEAHASLMHIAEESADELVVSIYVNPAQFGEGEDFDTYPRDFEADQAFCENENVDIMFCPDDDEMYGANHTVFIDETSVTDQYEGAFRPGHFRGVTTVVAKLIHATMADVAVFGEKDAQQLYVLRKMVEELNMPVKVIPGPIVREEDGLAMSSRNVYLDEQQRKSAACLSRALRAAAAAYDEGEWEVHALKSIITGMILHEPGAQIDYVDVVDESTFLPVEKVDGPSRILLAVRYGKTRLLDNRAIGKHS